MPNLVSYVDNTNQLAHFEMVKTIRDFAVANGWTELRYDTSTDNHELILQGVGYSGTEEIFIGFNTYHNVASDYYNLVCAAFTGYVAGNTFYTQPGILYHGVPCHNQRVDFWLTLNPQRIALAMKVGIPVYEFCYVGKFLPYATPSQYPYPMCSAGPLSGNPATRFSDTAHNFPFLNSSVMNCRFTDGSWLSCVSMPWYENIKLRDTNGVYSLIPAVIFNGNNVLGQLDGIAHITGFDNAVENTMTINGETWIVIQNVWRTGFNDYVAMRLDA